MTAVSFIYALHTDGVIFYCGRTDDMRRRYGEHIRSANPSGTIKERVLYQLIRDGANIDMKMLDTGTPEQLLGMEELWRVNILAEGHPLTNSRAGDDNPYLGYEPSTGPRIPWSIELFETADWKRGDLKAKSGEWCAWIKGVQFFRTGNRKLRFWHGEFGEWDVFGINMDAKYQSACDKLTQGTEENKKFLEAVAQQRRWQEK
jgi:hypothetical protein